MAALVRAACMEMSDLGLTSIHSLHCTAGVESVVTVKAMVPDDPIVYSEGPAGSAAGVSADGVLVPSVWLRAKPLT